MKYIIVPKKTYIEVVDADSADEALVEFATMMDSDMNSYFMAIPDPNEYYNNER